MTKKYVYDFFVGYKNTKIIFAKKIENMHILLHHTDIRICGFDDKDCGYFHIIKLTLGEVQEWE